MSPTLYTHSNNTRTQCARWVRFEAYYRFVLTSHNAPQVPKQGTEDILRDERMHMMELDPNADPIPKEDANG
jgi:hypothetical protein